MPSRGLWLRRLGLGLWALLGSAQFGCAASQNPQQATTFTGAGKRPELSCAREGAQRVDVASWRGTGRPDVARVYVRAAGGHGAPVLSCREVDLNGDGRKDVLVYYASDGHKHREEFDHDYDGIADVKSFYEQGQMVRQELDLNHDGTADMVQYFADGKMVRTERLMPGSDSDKPTPSNKASLPAAPGAPNSSSERAAPGTDRPNPPSPEPLRPSS